MVNIFDPNNPSIYILHDKCIPALASLAFTAPFGHSSSLTAFIVLLWLKDETSVCEVIKLTEMESRYQQLMAADLQKVSKLGRVDLVVGIPFLAAEQDAQAVISILEAGLDTFYPELKSLIICLISPSQSTTRSLEAYQSTRKDRILVTQTDRSLSGRGWAIRALMDIAHKTSADLLIVEPNLLAGKDSDMPEGLTPDWVKLMYQPIRDEIAQFVLPRFKMSHLANSIGSHFVFPLLASLFNVELRGCLDAGMTISRQLLPGLTEDLSYSSEEISEYGLNCWLIARILEQKVATAEVYLGVRPKASLPVGADYLFAQAAHVIFQFMGKSQKVWMKTPQAVRSPLTIGHREDLFVNDLVIDVRPHISEFLKGYTRYYEAVWSRIFPEDIANQLVKTAATGQETFSFPAALWTQVVYETIIAYHFTPGLGREDLVNSLSALFEGRLAGYLLEIEACPFNAQTNLETQVDAFISRKYAFQERWLHHKEELQPFLPEISYWEYIPGVPIILPQVVKSPSGRSAHVYEIYERLLKEYTDDFKQFIQENLHLTPEDGYEKVSQGIRTLVSQLEEDLDRILFPGDLHNPSETRRIVEKIFRLYPSPQSMSLKEEVAARLLLANPPSNLITIWGYHDTEELLQNHKPLDVLALAHWLEADQYSAWNTEWLRENLKPADFEMSPILPVVVDYTEFPTFAGPREASRLDHLSSRVVISNLREGSGGAFPKIRFLTTTLERIVEAEQYGTMWEIFIRVCGDGDFADRVINSIGGRWGVGMFSAHNVFENTQQIILRDKLVDIARQDWGLSGLPVEKAKEHMIRMANVYHLGLTLPEGVFITCCIRSWASYSFKGGKEIPTPLSLMVERRWFSSELFSRLYERVEGGREEILPIIVDLMGQNEENEDLAVRYLGATTVGTEIIIDHKLDRNSPLAGKLVRSPYNPILAPLSDHNWENKYVLNCGAIRVQGSVYIFYRAVGDDGISRIGLAISKNGLQVNERLPEPVFSPGNDSEKMGCEDPRLTAMEGRIYMLYTAYDGVTPQIALASISEEDMAAHNWSGWHRHGLVFPGFPNKDAILFPERFNGKLALYHRIAPSIWITYSDTFQIPWPREGHKIILGTRSGMIWDAVKIGAGAQPLKTRYGWLLIYHGVDYSFRYRLGVFLTSLDDPSRLLYRSPNPILEPEASYELGISGKSWVPNVVFTCGAVPVEDKEILDEEDEILVYYGGADTVIGVASAKVKDLIPERYRRLL